MRNADKAAQKRRAEARAATKDERRRRHSQGSRPAGKGGWTHDGHSRMGGDTAGSGHVAAGYNGSCASCA